MGYRLKAIICQIGLRRMYCELRRFSMSSSFLEVKVKGEGEQWKILVIEN